MMFQESDHDASSTRTLGKVVREPSTRRVQLWLCLCFFFIVMCPIVAVLIGLRFHTQDFEAQDLQSIYSGRMILLEAVLISADPKERKITFDWMIQKDTNTQCTNDTLSACLDVNIFFDNNLLFVDSTSDEEKDSVISNNRPERPVFRFNATTFAQKDIIANTATFRTTLALFSPNNLKSSLVYHPFDKYSAEILVFAQDAITNQTVGIGLQETRGIAAGFKTSVFPRPDVLIPPGAVDLLVTLERDTLVKVYVVVATIAIWIITLILLLVAITSAFFRFRQKGEVLVVPVATVFAFVSLRQSMPGAPEGFGDIMDFMGLLPCLALLSISAGITLGAFVLSDPEQQPFEMKWEYIRKAIGLDTESSSGTQP